MNPEAKERVRQEVREGLRKMKQDFERLQEQANSYGIGIAVDTIKSTSARQQTVTHLEFVLIEEERI